MAMIFKSMRCKLEIVVVCDFVLIQCCYIDLQNYYLIWTIKAIRTHMLKGLSQHHLLTIGCDSANCLFLLDLFQWQPQQILILCNGVVDRYSCIFDCIESINNDGHQQVFFSLKEEIITTIIFI